MPFFYIHRSVPCSTLPEKLMGTNTEAHGQTICRVRDLKILIPKQDVFIKSLLSVLREP